MNSKEIAGHLARTVRPFTQIALFFFIVIVEIPFLTFVCRQGLAEVGSEEFFTFMRNWKRMYDGTYQFSFNDIANGNFWLLYVSIGFIVAIFCGLPLARHFQYRDYSFYAASEERIARAAARSPEYARFLDGVGHHQVQSFLAPSKTKPEWGNLLRGLLWSVALIPVWPVLMAWVARLIRQRAE